MQNNVIRALEHGWEGIPAEGYRPGAAPGVERHTIVGRRKSDPSQSGPQLELRYFELAPGAATRLEKHEHEHFVIVKIGLGHAIVGENLAAVAPNDVVYVGSLEPHQFVNRGQGPFGFYCIVTAARDVSQELSGQDLRRLERSPAGIVMRRDVPRAVLRL
ncbi:MAG: cupin domain-containing protein [Candidatus Eremiobacteraeota bacterium]|nr:cupin domain-containing protein [Candidatus Eremiobacteraeota bacterium]